MKAKGGSRTQVANILNSQIVSCQKSTCPFKNLSLYGTLKPLFRDGKKAPLGSSRGLQSNESQVG